MTIITGTLYDMICIWYHIWWYMIYDVTWRDVTWRDVTWQDKTRHDMTRHDTTWHDTTRYTSIYYMIHLTAIGLTPGGSSTVNICKQYIEQHNRQQQYIEQHSLLIRNSGDRAPSLRGIPWHLPYNWGKSTEKPQSGYMKTNLDFLIISRSFLLRMRNVSYKRS